MSAQKANITEELVEWKRLEVEKAAIDKWTGIMPVVTGGSTPFIDFSSLMKAKT
jgi:hypothetical protein